MSFRGWRSALSDLFDDMTMRIAIVYCADAREALLKALSE
jgi:hypothetical protein